ncbi:6-phosphofructokinase [Pontibacter sp. BT310]|jgi:6-phosphofructokinase 1|uniref:ATP-dependent 6-phosphofructokinase n=1 Tax=Pontibacter populi TaxID=890055 RepID=A0ABS6X6G0_9BACT|nr:MULTISPECIES: 6-phosphofructokinase [Pontibacter]MBJ6116723.1 6-phosphofructokinase [Pontibacter sp. BT310]MBR0569147.1 6-phosphofructokinase [Microvirga sp. STS03]MBW3363577.1 6-phosphofructokinase [Pontibacter populi]
MKKIAVFTSGGDSPGMNACVRAVVRSAIYHGLEIYGIRRGYNGMIKGDIFKMESSTVSNIIQRGGTILKSARSKDFPTKEGRQQAYEQLQKFGIEGLIAIGGDGTFTGANTFYEEYGIPTIGAPGTIDNDLYGTDYTIGYDTAVNTAIYAIDKIRDTADSHERVFFVEVMGRDSGYIAIPCAVGGGAEIVMIPETKTTIEKVVDALQTGWSRSKTSFIVIVAEGDEEGTAVEIAAKVQKALPQMDARVTILGHVQRGGAPTAADRMLASQLGIACVEGLLQGRACEMAGIMNSELVYTPFIDTITKTKALNPNFSRMIDILSV